MANDVILEFRNEHGFLSNFYPAPITHRGHTYPTAEHLYQALKCADHADHERIRNLAAPGAAKRFGRKIRLRDDWNEVKDDTMRYVVERKFRQNPDLAQKLLATGDAVLMEGNTWGDKYWGHCLKTNQGLNKLGEILMALRAALRRETPAAGGCVPNPG